MKRGTLAAELDLDRLHGRSLAELRHLWREHIDESPPAQKKTIVRELAWRLQARRFGGFDALTQRLLNAAMKKVMREAAAKANGKNLAPRKRIPGPPTAARLVRTWRGKEHIVTVLEEGKTFEYAGRAYGSLSEIARAITGVRWSGPRFFGLVRRDATHTTIGTVRNGGS